MSRKLRVTSVFACFLKNEGKCRKANFFGQNFRNFPKVSHLLKCSKIFQFSEIVRGSRKSKNFRIFSIIRNFSKLSYFPKISDDPENPKIWQFPKIQISEDSDCRKSRFPICRKSTDPKNQNPNGCRGGHFPLKCRDGHKIDTVKCCHKNRTCVPRATQLPAFLYAATDRLWKGPQ